VIRKVSEKRLRANGGKMWSTIAKKPKPVKKRNAKRRKSEFARCYHSAERVEFVKSLPCAVSGLAFNGELRENAHIEGGGAGRKADYTKIIPLCRRCHQQLHSFGRKDFEQYHGCPDLDQLAAETESRWLSYLSNGATK
jgi:hypothetical protein